MIAKALEGETLSVYVRGENVRDWLFIEDHLRTLQAVFERASRTSLQYRWQCRVVAHRRGRNLCTIFDQLGLRAQGGCYVEQTGFVADRPDTICFAIDTTRTRNEFITGLYVFDRQVCDLAAGLTPSARGELEITDLVRCYLDAARYTSS